MTPTKTGPKPARRMTQVAEYSVKKPGAPTDLKLDANEGTPPPKALLDRLHDFGDALFCRYVKATFLEEKLARVHGVEPGQVLVTAGGDEAIDRVCRAFVEPGSEIVLPHPTFDMFYAFGRLAQGVMRPVPWFGETFPTDAFCAAITENTSLVIVVSPNNPTGVAVAFDDIRQLSEAAPHAVILLDMAYGPFADVNLAAQVRELPNVIGVFTFSKAFGMAGLRVGYARGPAHLIETMRAAGAPYPCSNASLSLAAAWLDEGGDVIATNIANIRKERAALEKTIDELGGRAVPSQANFVFARFRDADWVIDAMAGMGVLLRRIPDQGEFEGGLRITCPNDVNDFQRLNGALQTVLSPQALLFDMDGVLVDVSGSYRQAILQTAASFGATINEADIAEAKAAGGANDDWELTHRLIATAGIDASLEEVTERFEELYQGANGTPGLKENETLVPSAQWLAALAERYLLGIVTGRPRSDAESFLRKHDIERFFATVVTREDGPLKPDPTPLRIAMERLGISRTWYLGDTPDDIRSARSAGVLPIGVAAPGDDHGIVSSVLVGQGAARVLEKLQQLEELLP